MFQARFFAAFCASLVLCAAQPLEKRQPSVILISIDTLRADHLGAYGATRLKTPNIDSYADHGTLYSNIDAQVPLTLPSHASLFTSTYPFENRVEENAERVPAGAVTLASILRTRGYKTAAFIGSVFLERQMGLDQGFETYDSPFQFAAFSPLSGSMFYGGASRNPNAGRDRRDGALVTRAATQFLAANRDRPVFVFVHLYDLHKPYKLSGYDPEVEYVDGLLGSFRKALATGGWWDRSLVILLSDHGEGLGDHGESSHGYFIYESTLHVPLIVHWPSSASGFPARVDNPAGLIDVAPTILDFLNVPAPASFEGNTLLAGRSARAVYGESLHTHDSFGWAPLRSLRLGAYKYIEAPRPELYDLKNDAGEKHNLLTSNSAEAHALRRHLAALLSRYAPRRAPAPGNISPQTSALLSSLGYLAPGPASKLESSGADPKDRLPEFQLYEKAMIALYDGHTEVAIAILRRILAQDPRNTLARRDLGATYLERRLYSNARAAFERVIAAAPDDYMTQYELGIADERLGFLKEARQHLEAACKIAPEARQSRRELDALRQKME